MDIDEKRVYDDRDGARTAYVAAGSGVVAAAISGAIVGEFTLVRRTAAADVAAGESWVAVATDEDVLVAAGDRPADPTAVPGGDFAATDFGPATAVGAAGGDLLAAAPDGRIGRVVDVAGEVAEGTARDGADDVEWYEVADVDAAVRAIDGDLIAAADGVYRSTPDGIDEVGLDDARDVAAAGPLAATGEGLYRLGNGWLDELPGPFRAVAARRERGGPRAVAAGDAVSLRDDGEWRERPAPVAPVDVAFAGPRPVVAAADGTVAVADDEAPDGWRTRNVGVREIEGLAVAGD